MNKKLNIYKYFVILCLFINNIDSKPNKPSKTSKSDYSQDYTQYYPKGYFDKPVCYDAYTDIDLDLSDSVVKPKKAVKKTVKKEIKKADTTKVNSENNIKKLDELNTQNGCLNNVFDKEVINNPKPVVVKFTAKWCGPCQQMAPAFEQAAQEYAGKVDFIEVDIDNCTEIKDRFKINSVPQLHFYKKDKKSKKLVKVGEMPGGISNPQIIMDQVKLYLKV